MTDDSPPFTVHDLGKRKAKPLLKSEPLDLADDEEWIEPRQWILGNTYCRKFLSGLTGVGAVGKTAARIVQAFAVGTGRELTGEKVFMRTPVLFVCMEDDLEELRRRFRAARIFYNITKEQYAGYIHIWAIKGEHLAAFDDRGIVTTQILYKEVVRHIRERNIGLVIFDPFIKTHDVKENDNSAIDKVVTVLITLAEEMNVGVDILHHVGKGLKEAGDSEAGRGASALKDGGRLFRTATVMTEDESKKFNIEEDRRKFYFRIDASKVNLAPPTHDTMWFELVGVELGNVTETYPHGDNVQTVRRWLPPEEMIGGVAAILGQKILDIIDSGLPDGKRYSVARNARGESNVVNAILSVIKDLSRERALDVYDKLRGERWVFNGDYRVDRKTRTGLFVRDGKVKPEGEDDEEKVGDGPLFNQEDPI